MTFLKDFDKTKATGPLKSKGFIAVRKRIRTFFPKVKVSNGKLTVRLGFFFSVRLASW